jgi:excisionase family DNA binding protein
MNQQLLRTAAVARLLNVSESCTRRLIRDGLIPSIRVGPTNPGYPLPPARVFDNSSEIADLNNLAERLFDFQYYWEAAAKPFEWKFSRQDLNELLNKMNTPR